MPRLEFQGSPVASERERWCVFLIEATAKFCGLGGGAGSALCCVCPRGRSSSSMRLRSLVPCDFFLDGRLASELYASSSQAHFSEKSADCLHL